MKGVVRRLLAAAALLCAPALLFPADWYRVLGTAGYVQRKDEFGQWRQVREMEELPPSSRIRVGKPADSMRDAPLYGEVWLEDDSGNRFAVRAYEEGTIAEILGGEDGGDE